jgi:hypothetical protein
MTRILIGPVRRPEPVPVAAYDIKSDGKTLWLSVFHGCETSIDRLSHCSTVPMTASAARMLAEALLAEAESMPDGVSGTPADQPKGGA